MTKNDLRLLLLGCGFVPVNAEGNLYTHIASCGIHKITYLFNLQDNSIGAEFPDIEYNKRNYTHKNTVVTMTLTNGCKEVYEAELSDFMRRIEDTINSAK